MPKAGSTAFQWFLNERYDELKARGILYPMVGREDDPRMRHHWMINALLLDDRAAFYARMKRVEDECDDATHTVILSSEPFVTHVPDFRPEPRRWLGELRETYDVSTWLWLRDPVAFCTSWYMQTLRSPHTESFPVYGRDISVSEFLDMPWVSGAFDYVERCREIEAIFGPGSLFTFAYEPEIVATACALLSIEDLYLPVHKNVSWMRELGVRLLRAINVFELDAAEKRAALLSVKEISRIVGGSPFEITETEAARVSALCTMNAETIARLGAISRERWAATMMPA